MLAQITSLLARYPVRPCTMLRALNILFLAVFTMTGLGAIPFYWEAKTEEPGFTIDVPSLWSQASRARDKVANVHFEKNDRAGRVAIEVRSYTSENTDIDQLVLQLRTRLAVKYDRVFLVKRKEVGFRKSMEKQVWTARSGKRTYTLTTAFVVSEDKVLQLICIAPANRRKEYEFVFDNALLSLDFSDGKPEGGDAGKPEKPEPAAAPAAAQPAAPAAQPAAAPAAQPAAAQPAAAQPAAKPKPPKIEF